jgi:hypothetical protein
VLVDESRVYPPFIWFFIPSNAWRHWMMGQIFDARRIGLLKMIMIVAMLSVASAVSEAQTTALPSCQAAGPVVRVAELPEGSGIAVSRRSPGRLWAHNDSGEPVLLALDSRGSVTGTVRLTGITVDDWEAVAVGACPGGSCVYIADIGDNAARRRRITVYRVPEPDAETSVVVREAFHATYPDGAHDAEALLVAPDGGMFIVTKGDTGTVGLYRFPRELRSGATHRLERVGTPRGSRNTTASERITDGAVSADGQWVVLRTRQSLAFYRATALLAGIWGELGRVDLRSLGEAQGEGVAMAADGSIYVSGEGGGRSAPGTFGRLTCMKLGNSR